jgi:TatA/E family protein of Tat protein translocase
MLRSQVGRHRRRLLRSACDNATVPFGIGQWELIVLAAVLILVFGTSRVPQIARQLGLGLREVRRTVDDVDPRKPLRDIERPADEQQDRIDAPPR